MRILNMVFCGVIALAGMALSASGQGVPFATKVVSMQYPGLAVGARITGTAMLAVRIDDNGKVISATGVFGHPLLIKEAKSNLMLWTFAARKAAGGQARLEFDFAYVFELKGEPKYDPRVWQTFTYEYPNEVTIVSPPHTLEVTWQQPSTLQKSK